MAEDFTELLQRYIDKATVEVDSTQIKAAGVNTGDYKAQLRATKNESGIVRATVDASKIRADQATTGIKSAADAAAQAQADSATADQVQAAAVASNHKYFNDLFGISTDPNADIAKTARLAKAAHEDALSQLSVIQEMQGVSFLDNPLEALVNAIDLPGMKQKYNTTAAVADTLQDIMDRQKVNASGIGDQVLKGIPTISIAQSKAKADLAFANATKAKSDADLAAANRDVEFAAKKFSQELAILQGQGQLTQFELQNSQAAYQAQIARIGLAKDNETRLLQASQLAQTLTNEKALAAVLRNYDLMTGRPTGTTQTGMFKLMSQKQRDEIIAMGATSSFGVTMVDSLENIRQVGIGPNVSSDLRQTVDYISSVMEDIRKTDSFMKDPTKDPLKQREHLAKQVETRIASDALGAAKNPNSIWHELSVQAMLVSGKLDGFPPEVKGDLQKLSGSGVPPTTQQILEVFNLASKGNPNEAGAMAAKYYSSNVDLRNNTLNLRQLGWRGKMPSNYTINAGAGFFDFGAPKNLDLTKPEAATAYFLWKKVKADSALTPEDFNRM